MITVDRNGIPTLVQDLHVTDTTGLHITFDDVKGRGHSPFTAHHFKRTLTVYNRNLAEGLVDAVDMDVIETAWHEAEEYMRRSYGHS